MYVAQNPRNNHDEGHALQCSEALRRVAPAVNCMGQPKNRHSLDALEDTGGHHPHARHQRKERGRVQEVPGREAGEQHRGGPRAGARRRHGAADPFPARDRVAALPQAHNRQGGQALDCAVDVGRNPLPADGHQLAQNVGQRVEHRANANHQSPFYGPLPIAAGTKSSDHEA